MKCPNCDHDIDLKEVKQTLINNLLQVDWKEMILKCANISTVGAEDIANTVKDKIQKIVNKIE